MIKDLKDLKGLLKLCRSQGVTEIELGEVKLKFGDMPAKEDWSASADSDEDPYANFPQGLLTPEQEIHYAMGGTVEDDPYIKKGSA